MLPVFFGLAARAELLEAIDWYKSHAPAIVDRFICEVDAAIARLSETLQRYPLVYRGLRRIRLNRFPYGLFYQIEENRIYVIACFHSNRDPKRWQERN